MKKTISFYIIIIFILAIFSYAFIDPNLIFLRPLYSGFSFSNREVTTGLYLILVIVLTAIYLFFIRQYLDKHLQLKQIKRLIFGTVIILFFSYPAMLSYDIFNYIATAKVTFFYKENPYIVMPIEFVGDPLLLFTHAANKTALYGPVWIIITGLPYLLGFGNFFLTLFLFKFLIIVFYLITLFLIYKLTKSWFSILLFALNPLVVIETIVSGHNDIVMMGLTLAAVYFLKKKKLFIAVVFLLLSIGIKFATVSLIPIFLYLIIMSVYKRQINWGKVYYWSACLMFAIFLLSPLREEMYPWYAQWFFIFVCLIPNKIKIVTYSLFLLFGLMLRYVPFMYYGSYNEVTVFLRTILTIVPFALFLVISLFNRQIKIYLN